MTEMEIKFLDIPLVVVGLEQPRKLAMMRKLESEGKIKVTLNTNSHGHQYYTTMPVRDIKRTE